MAFTGHFLLDKPPDVCRLAMAEMTGVAKLPTNGIFQPTCVYAIMSFMFLPLFIVFVLGIGSFAMHEAVRWSGHPMLESIPKPPPILGIAASLWFEYAVLLLAMLFVSYGWHSFVWIYALYFAINALTAWLILSNRL